MPCPAKHRVTLALALLLTGRAAIAQTPGTSVWPTWHPYPYGGRTATMGGAGVAAGRDSAMPLLNPAGLAQLDRQNLSLSASAYTLHAFEVDGFFASGEAGTADGPQTHGPLDVMRSQTVDAFPTSFVYSHPFGAEVGASGHQVLSFAVLVPLRYDDGLRGRYALESAGFRVDWLVSRKTQASSYHLGPSYAVQIGRHVRLGAGVFGLYQPFSRRVSLTDRISYGAEGQDGNTIDTVDALSLDGLVSAGAQVELPGGFQLGLAARSPSLHLYGHLEQDGAVASHASPGIVLDGVSGGSFTQVVRLRTDDFEIRHPLRVSLGLGWERPRQFAFALDAHYVADNDYRWASGTVDETLSAEDGTLSTTRTHQRVRAQDDWLVNLNVGVEVFVTEMVALRVGAFTDLSPAAPVKSQPDQRDLFRRKVNLYGGTAGLGFLLGAVDFTVGAVLSTGEGEIAALRNPVGDPGARFPVAGVTETRLTGIVTGGVTFGEAVAPVTAGLERPVAAVAARFRSEPPRALRLSELDSALAALEGGPRDDLAARVGPDGTPDPIVYEVVGEPTYDALFRDVARLEAAVVVLQGSLGRAGDAIERFRSGLADVPPEARTFDETATDAALLIALRAATGSGGATEPALRALVDTLAEEERLCRRALQAMGREALAIAARARDVFERARNDGAVDAAVAIAVAARQCLSRAQSAGRTLVSLEARVRALFGGG